MSLLGLESIQYLSRLIDDSFPSMDCVICYGSAAFRQVQQTSDAIKQQSAQNGNTYLTSLSLANNVSPYFQRKMNDPMLDFIFVVNDAQQWHSENLSTANYYHYSTFLRLFGSGFVSYFQSLGPGVLYNPFVFMPNHGILMKYGVITTSQLVHDLVYWKSLYIAGRLHKPVVFVTTPTTDNADTTASTTNATEQIDNDYLERFYQHISFESVEFDSQHLNDSIMLNRDYAVRVALMNMISAKQKQFTLTEVFLNITALSYRGDMRHDYGAEDIHKYAKIVNGSYAHFVEIYSKFLANYIETSDGESYTLKSHVDTKYLCRRLPYYLKDEMLKFDAEIWDNLDDVERTCKCLNHALSNIVKTSSWIQSVKGIISAGFMKSFWYIARKMNKHSKSVQSQRPIASTMQHV